MITRKQAKQQSKAIARKKAYVKARNRKNNNLAVSERIHQHAPQKESNGDPLDYSFFHQLTARLFSPFRR